LGTRCMHRPRAAYPGSLRGVAAPPTSLLCPCATRHTLTGPILIPCSVVPPPRSSSSTYRILTPIFFLDPLRFGVSSYPPGLLTPRLARPSYPGFTGPELSFDRSHPLEMHRGARRPERALSRHLRLPPDMLQIQWGGCQRPPFRVFVLVHTLVSRGRNFFDRNHPMGIPRHCQSLLCLHLRRR